MPDMAALALFMSVTFALNITPGPDMLLNPKVALFFPAFLPQFTDPARGSVGRQVLILGLLFITSGTIVNVAVAWFASALTARARESSRTTLWLQRLTGAVFVGLGLRLITHSRR